MVGEWAAARVRAPSARAAEVGEKKRMVIIAGEVWGREVDGIERLLSR